MDASSVLAQKAERAILGQQITVKAASTLAETLKRGEIRLDRSAGSEREMKKLQTLRGIGGWTAQYVSMRTMGWPDAFLETDAGVKHALPDKSSKELSALAERWRPWRSYAVVNLWFKEE